MPSVPTVREQPNPFNQYGAGAESKMRLDEGNVNNNNSSSAAYRAVPLSEGRMRIQEQSRYATSLEANISRGTDLMVRNQERDRSPKYPTAGGSGVKATTTTPTASAAVVQSRGISGDGSISSNLVNRKKPSTSAAKNPFDDEDDTGYDESKNPFADETDGAKLAAESDKNNKDSNPFDEYDNNLNPFA